MKVTLTEPGIAGSYDVVENEDGRLVLEEPRADLGRAARRQGTRGLTVEEFEQVFGDLGG